MNQPPEGQPRPRRKVHILQLLPNLVSILGLCSGLTAIRFAIDGRVATAIALIGLAAALDALDGRLARMLKSESAIGAELDSLGDFVNFGVTPAIVLYLWGLKGEASLGWIAVLIYAICCMLRLARFNVGNKRSDGEEPAERTSFIGVPSPAGAMLVLAPVYLAFCFPGDVRLPAEAVAIWMVAMGALMISRIRTPSLKRVTFYAEDARYILVALVALFAALFTYPWVTLLSLSLAYLAGILFVARGQLFALFRKQD
ncbi:CDP-diacylglycerol--serine O-phosphatidyltransferase [Rhodobacter sp. HX-7-19]|uniref:CDP-diacylglycerol--serine O-phosphatidyltransferase n=1 Tax=Paragemmobacter kunshanensis TaxID=2583234 RepID=A0A6M1TPC3_9RHOB|nr:CDP-diacylglycerol--serine O-phosphatidyltransferase [Rhodobacter kunshanensis]NGQ89847.1 CDP-diacylglycerol--serine O-phosphatidyltransferase [Rhodobacter kunshanensis]